MFRCRGVILQPWNKVVALDIKMEINNGQQQVVKSPLLNKILVFISIILAFLLDSPIHANFRAVEETQCPTIPDQCQNWSATKCDELH